MGMMGADAPTALQPTDASTISSVAMATPSAPAASPPLALQVKPPHAPVATADALQPLVLLQSFDGSWALEQPLALVLELSLECLEPEQSISEKAWATALGVAFLRHRLHARKEEWILVSEKALAWLAGAGHDAEALVAQAL